MKKFIKGFLEKINEGVRVDPNNPDEVILTYSNLSPNHPEYNDEVLVTLVNKKDKKSPYIVDKHVALVMPSENQLIEPFKKIKTLDHKGRPKATMDLLKNGKIKGGQAALDDFLTKAIPYVVDKVKYVAALGSTKGLVKMIEDFFISKHGAIPVGLPKMKFPTILDAVDWDRLTTDFVKQEETTKKEVQLDLIHFKYQDKFTKARQILTIPYRDPTTDKIVKKYLKDPRLDSTLIQKIVAEIKKGQTTIVDKFFSSLEEAIDISSTAKTVYDQYFIDKKIAINDIIDMYIQYRAAGLYNLEEIPPLEETASVLSPQVESIIMGAVKNLTFLRNYSLRSSGTSLGTSMRKMYKSKYQIGTSFEDAVIDCIQNEHQMIIIDDNILSGIDLKRVDSEILKITLAAGKRPLEVYKYIKMFVLYDMQNISDKSKKGTRTIYDFDSQPLHDIDYSKGIVPAFYDFISTSKNRIKKIPNQIVLSYGVSAGKTIPSPSLPELVLDIDSTGTITNININLNSPSTQLHTHDPLFDPLNWNMTYDIGNTIFDNAGNLIQPFVDWTRSIGVSTTGKKIGLFVNGVKL